MEGLESTLIMEYNVANANNKIPKENWPPISVPQGMSQTEARQPTIESTTTETLLALLGLKLENAKAKTKQLLRDSWRPFNDMKRRHMEDRDVRIDNRCRKSQHPRLRRAWERVKDSEEWQMARTAVRHEEKLKCWTKRRDEVVICCDYLAAKRHILQGQVSEHHLQGWTMGALAEGVPRVEDSEILKKQNEYQKNWTFFALRASGTIQVMENLCLSGPV
ncbi:hypothetical protein B0H63DRAFT_447458 [Podospora didyma]|uniref:Uncharacterized protein n=1 Tax=Podospora didyma TaxID=330526 RepID=A0AAE0U0W8_9PEZI|nr:hypothetical protein B0H63DRAFT_447458 [Podospora didyma]